MDKGELIEIENDALGPFVPYMGNLYRKWVGGGGGGVCWDDDSGPFLFMG